ncbi:MAG: hypothetical protein CMB76_02980 [Euryarchaeota archaeon]|nr:hypothetical protein [Euryarchaeota archaeon]
MSNGLILNDDDYYGSTPGYNLPSVDEVKENVTPDNTSIVPIPKQGFTDYGDQMSSSLEPFMSTVDPQFIKKTEKITEDEMINNPSINTALRNYLAVSGAGTLADNFTNEEVWNHFQTRMRNVDSSDVGILNEGLAVARAKQEEYPIYKNAYDIYDKYPGIFSRWKEEGWSSKWDAISGLMEHLANTANPFESPTNYVPGIVLPKLLGRWAVKKQIKDAAFGTALEQGVKQYTKGQILKNIGAVTIADMALAYGLDKYYQETMIKVGKQDEYNQMQGFLSLFEGMIGGGIELALSGQPLTKKKFFNFEGFYTKKVKTDKQKEAIVKKIGLKADALTKFWEESTQKGEKLLGEDEVFASRDFMDFFLFGNDDLKVKGMVQHMVEELDLRYFVDLRNQKGSGQFVAAFSKLLKETLSPQQKGAYTKAMRRVKDRLNEEGTLESEMLFSTVDLDQPDAFDKFIDSMNYKFSDAGKTLQIGKRISTSILSDLDIEKNILAEKLGEEKLLKNLKKRPFSYFQQGWKRGLVSTWSTTALNMGGWTATTGLNVATDTALMLNNLWAMPLNVIGESLDALTGNKSWATVISSKAMTTARNTRKNLGFRLATLLEPNATREAFDKMMLISPESAKSLQQVIVGGVDVRDVNELAKKFGYAEKVTSTKYLNAEEQFKDAISGDGKKIKTKSIQGVPPWWMSTNEAYLKFVQKMGFVTAIDTFTKSQSYLGHIDRLLREKYNKGFREFMAQDEETLKTALTSTDFFNIQAGATESTLKDIFSKSYHSGKGVKFRDAYGFVIDRRLPDPLGWMASRLEEVGDVPLIGTLMPFGKFFNNSVAFTYNSLGGGNINMMAELYRAGMRGKSISSEKVRDFIKSNITGGGLLTTGYIANQMVSDFTGTELEDASFLETMMSGSIKYTLIGACAERDMEKQRLGMSWNMELIDGRPKDITYLFPYSQCAILGRVVNVLRQKNVNPITGEDSTVSDLSPTLVKELGEQLALSQLTRNTSSIFNFDTILKKVVNEDTKSFVEITSNAILAMPTNYISGYTRPLADPIQKLSTYALGEDDQKLVVKDRDSGDRILYNASRYVTNLMRMLGGDGPVEYYMEPKSSMLRTDKEYTSGGWYDILGFKGMGQPTNMERLLNIADMRAWNQEYRSKFPQADKYVRSVIAPYLENAAYHKLKDKEFLAKSPEDKRIVVKAMLNDIKGRIIEEIREGLVLPEIEIRGGEGQSPNMGTRQYLLRLKTISDIAQYDNRTLIEAIQSYNKAVAEGSRLPLNTNTDDMLSMSDFELREILKFAKLVKKKREQ